VNITLQGAIARQDIASAVDLEVSFEVEQSGPYTVVTFSGPDEEIFEAFLVSRYRRFYRLRDLEEGKVYPGRLVDVGKVGFGVYCAIGSERDVLLDLHGLREVFSSTASTRQIIFSQGLVEGLCVEAEVTRIDRGLDRLWGRLSPAWIERTLIPGAVIVAGISAETLSAAIASSPFRDTTTMESLCERSHRIICSGITEPPGVVAYLGRKLREARFGIVGER